MHVVGGIILYLVVGEYTKLPLNVWPVQDRIGHGPVVVRPRVILHHLYIRDHLPFRFYFKQASHLKKSGSRVTLLFSDKTQLSPVNLNPLTLDLTSIIVFPRLSKVTNEPVQN